MKSFSESPIIKRSGWKDWHAFFLAYTFSYGLYLFNKGLFFDDWWISGNTSENLITIFHMMGVGWLGYIYNLIEAAPHSILIYRFIAFLCYFFSGIFLNEIVKTIREVDKISRLYIVLIFILFPINHIRFTIGVTLFTISHFLFFAGFWLLKKYFDHRYILWRILSQLLFFLSMSTNSIVMFYLIIFIYILYRERNGKSYFNKIAILKKYFDYVMLPIVFILLRFTVLIPYGLYKGSNQFEIEGLILAPLRLVPTLYFSVIEPIDVSIHAFNIAPVFIILLAYLFFSYIHRQHSFESMKQGIFYLKGLILGLVIFFLGVFPYLVVQKYPMLQLWSSRQLLVPLGVAFLIYYGITYMFQKLRLKDYLRYFTFCILIALFMFCNFNYYLEYQKDWLRQLSLRQFFSQNILFKDASSFLIDDKILGYYSYKIPRILNLAYNDNKIRSTYDENNFSTDMLVAGIDLRTLKPHTPSKPQYRIIIKPGLDVLSRKDALKLIVLEILSPKKFKELVSKITQVEYQALSSLP